MTNQEVTEAPVPRVTDEEWVRLANELSEEWVRASQHYLTEEGCEDVTDVASIMVAAADKVQRAVRYGYTMTKLGIEPPVDDGEVDEQ